MSYYIYDIDGTLANIEHRAQYVRVPKGTKKDWKSFFHPDNMMQDQPYDHVVQILKAFRNKGVPAIYCTGRPEHLRKTTLEWLDKHVENFFPETEYRPFFQKEISKRLFMRPSDDHGDDSVVKPNLVRQIIEIYGQPLAMFEDRDRVVAAVRAMGVPVFQVQEGNF